MLQNLNQLGKSSEKLSESITAIEAGYIWSTLLIKYQIIQRTQIYINYVDDADFKVVLQKGLDFLVDESIMIEKDAKKFGIATPPRPPAVQDPNARNDAINDEFIFKQVFLGIKAMIPLRAAAYIECTTTNVRDIFANHLLREIKLYDGLIEYGKIKGWIEEPPVYRL